MATEELLSEKEYTTLMQYFEDHPDELEGYIEDMEELQDEILDYPEDW